MYSRGPGGSSRTSWTHVCRGRESPSQVFPLPPSKAEVVERLRVRGEAGLFVDDHPENCLDVLSNCGGVEVWVMSRQFNREFDHPQVRRAENWQCLFDRLGRVPANS